MKGHANKFFLEIDFATTLITFTESKIAMHYGPIVCAGLFIYTKISRLKSIFGKWFFDGEYLNIFMKLCWLV